ncbi:hypothetical protein GUJ93_ZPchr0010g8599 [Zizania palustris]|uniref:Secreted protein n=1 Tax=Zizania palustris TaxID=103762 RepID=A0A8J5W7L5_ZIZPA|nr:hypothetical protein GUJ93_ZPchr0010g8599 [Zizania palustris]
MSSNTHFGLLLLWSLSAIAVGWTFFPSHRDIRPAQSCSALTARKGSQCVASGASFTACRGATVGASPDPVPRREGGALSWRRRVGVPSPVAAVALAWFEGQLWLCDAIDGGNTRGRRK